MHPTLELMHRGQSGVILSMDEEVREELCELGFSEGLTVSMVRVCGPMRVVLRGEQVEVPPEAGPRVVVELLDEPETEATEEVDHAVFSVGLVGPPELGARLGQAEGELLLLQERTAALLTQVPRGLDDLLTLEQPPPHALVVALRAEHLEADLTRLLQVQLLGLPVVVAFSGQAAARRKGVEHDLDALAEHLGLPVVELDTSVGPTRLRTALVLALRTDPPCSCREWHWSPTPALEAALRQLHPAAEALIGLDQSPCRARAVALWALAGPPPEARLPDAFRDQARALRLDLQGAGHPPLNELRASLREHALQDTSRFTRKLRPHTPNADPNPLYLALGLVVLAILVAVAFFLL